MKAISRWFSYIGARVCETTWKTGTRKFIWRLAIFELLNFMSQTTRREAWTQFICAWPHWKVGTVVYVDIVLTQFYSSPHSVEVLVFKDCFPRNSWGNGCVHWAAVSWMNLFSDLARSFLFVFWFNVTDRTGRLMLNADLETLSRVASYGTEKTGTVLRHHTVNINAEILTVSAVENWKLILLFHSVCLPSTFNWRRKNE